MPFDAITDPDSPAFLVKHALLVWAREEGIAEDGLPGLTDAVLNFAVLAIRDARIARTSRAGVSVRPPAASSWIGASSSGRTADLSYEIQG